jgi:hypothetical protein
MPNQTRDGYTHYTEEEYRALVAPGATPVAVKSYTPYEPPQQRPPEQPTETKPRLLRRGGAPETGIALLIFAAPMWISGARFTVDGIRLVLNWVLAWLTVPARIPAPTGWALLATAAIVGLLCSRIEIVRFPLRFVRGTIVWLGFGALIGWLLTSVGDAVTTYIGLTSPPAGAWAIHTWAARTLWASSSATAVLTFGPELMWAAALYLLGWRVPNQWRFTKG